MSEPAPIYATRKYPAHEQLGTLMVMLLHVEIEVRTLRLLIEAYVETVQSDARGN